MGALKKPTPPVKTPAIDSSTKNQVEKAEIERMKKLLSEKIKDPNLAKKAALIISDMINK